MVIDLDFPGFNGHLGVFVRKLGRLYEHSTQNVRLNYTFIKAHRREFDTAMMYHLLDVSRGGFYAWLRNPLSKRAREDQRLLGLIRAACIASHGVYGAPRIFLDLRAAG